MSEGGRLTQRITALERENARLQCERDKMAGRAMQRTREADDHAKRIHELEAYNKVLQDQRTTAYYEGVEDAKGRDLADALKALDELIADRDDAYTRLEKAETRAKRLYASLRRLRVNHSADTPLPDWAVRIIDLGLAETEEQD